MPREERIERVAVLLVFSTCSSCGLHSSFEGPDHSLLNTLPRKRKQKLVRSQHSSIIKLIACSAMGALAHVTDSEGKHQSLSGEILPHFDIN